MSDEQLVRRLRDLVHAADLDAGNLVVEARQEARAAARDVLVRLMTHELLERAAAALQPSTHPVGRSDAVTSPRDPGAAGTSSETGDAASPPTRVVYLLGITRVADAVTGDDLPTLPGAGPVRVLDAAGLRLLVCDVGGDTLARLGRAEPQDLEVLARAATAHDEILTRISGVQPVLPLRLGTVVDDEEAAVAVLRRHASNLRAELDRLTGHAEWSVTVHHVVDPAPAEPARTEAATAGRAYLERRRDDVLARERRREVSQGLAEASHQRLRRHATESTTVEPRGGDGVPPLLHGVYLVREVATTTFLAEVERLRREAPEAVVTVSGPLPPYHFAILEVDEEDTP